MDGIVIKRTCRRHTLPGRRWTMAERAEQLKSGDNQEEPTRRTWSREFLALAGSAPDFPYPDEPPLSEPDEILDDEDGLPRSFSGFPASG
jgi:hypothetical protein